MSGTAILGNFCGDEGKGRIIDYYVGKNNIDMVARFSGSGNAGHTIQIDDQKFILRQVPSGILHPNVNCVLGNGMVIDPLVLEEELNNLTTLGIDFKDRLLISKNAHVIMPYHILADKNNEESDHRVGSTKRGVGPAYEDKIGRRGIRISELSRCHNQVFRNLNRWNIFNQNCISDSVFEERRKDCLNSIERYQDILNPFVCDTVQLVNDALKHGSRVVFEGAQGSMLDIDHGTYPFVTSSNSTIGGVCTGLGIPPQYINKVIGVFKAYDTRVGLGPFETELFGPESDSLRNAGHEYGSVTARPRRVGWLNLNWLKRSCMINGVTELALTKLDVFSNWSSRIKVLTSYGYQSFNGWKSDITKCRKWHELPFEAREFVSYIENYLQIPITMISVGPERNSIIEKEISQVKGNLLKYIPRLEE